MNNQNQPIQPPPRRKRAVFLALSGVCAMGAAFWTILLPLANNFIVDPLCYFLGLDFISRGIGMFIPFFERHKTG